MKKMIDLEEKTLKEEYNRGEFKDEVTRDHTSHIDHIESTHKIHVEEIEFKNKKRIESEKVIIDKEMSNLLKIAESKEKPNKQEPLSIKIAEEEIAKIKTKKRELIVKEFQLKLDKEKQELLKNFEELDNEKQNLKKIYEKKENTAKKEKELDFTKEMREIQKKHKEQVKKDKEKVDTKIKESKENQKILFQQKVDQTHKDYLSKIEEYKIHHEDKIKTTIKEYEEELNRKYNKQKEENSTGNKVQDMVKEIKRHNLELENEIIRKEREEKKQKEEFIKLQVKHEDLQNSNTMHFSSGNKDDSEFNRLYGELNAKQRRLNHLLDLIKEQQLATFKAPKTKSMKTAKRIVEEIGTAIETVQVPERKVEASSGFRIENSKKVKTTRELMPISTKISEIFEFTSKEIKRV